MIPIKQLHGYLRYSAIDVEFYLKDFSKFLKFLKEYVDLFYTDGDYVCSENAQKKLEKRNFNLNKIEETSFDERLLKKVSFVYNLETGKRVCDYILSNIKCIAFDSEGSHLGDEDGVLTLIQIAFVDGELVNLDQATIVENVNIFFFDILTCPDLVKECIEPILIDKEIVKVLHDTRSDFNALLFGYNVNRIYQIFDTSKIYFKLTNSTTNGLHTIYEEIFGLMNQNLKPKMKQYYKQNYRLSFIF